MQDCANDVTNHVLKYTVEQTPTERFLRYIMKVDGVRDEHLDHQHVNPIVQFYIFGKMGQGIQTHLVCRWILNLDLKWVEVGYIRTDLISLFMNLHMFSILSN